jgi:NAD(P)-dependent dehydrogenase (short-subunit alcohol dehydrogenase family)
MSMAAYAFDSRMRSQPGMNEGEQRTAIVTGGNRGIGFEFVRQYAEQGWAVIAGARSPSEADDLWRLSGQYGDVSVEKLDVSSPSSIDALAEKLRGTPIDVVINNAGVFGEFPSQAFGALDFDQFDTFMRTNALGPLKMCEAFLEHVKAGTEKKMVSVTSQAGSFGLNSGGLPGMYFYKSSKAAQNMIMRNVAEDVRQFGIAVCVLSPGMVNTAGDIPPERRFPGLIEPPESVAGMIEVIDELTLEQSGKFIRYTHEEQPW